MRLRTLHRGALGPVPLFLERLRVQLCATADLPAPRLIVLDVRGEYMKFSVLGLSSSLMDKLLTGQGDLPLLLDAHGEQRPNSSDPAIGVSRDETQAAAQEKTIVDFE